MTSLLPIIESGSPTGVVRPFGEVVREKSEVLVRHCLTDLQINLGKLCNQACTHCHVEAGPTKTRENMDRSTAERIVSLAASCDSLETIDLTGGAPELNPHFRMLVEELRGQGRRVIDRCNLTVLSEPKMEWLADFLKEYRVDIVASLPCYLEDNVDVQRGSGVFQRSIEALLQLNAMGYGQPDSGLRLDLVYNPNGAVLPPDQFKLQQSYQAELKHRYGIVFNNLLTITNLPVKRFAKFLSKRGELENYFRLLEDNFNPEAAKQVMCRSLLSISWDGLIFDCDFNQMLGLGVGGSDATSIWDIDSLNDFVQRPISVADHCYACTAGAGSSCGGAITRDG
ncbi:arsenosugar biosynthesis radical SAM protein ArsS [bacterium]|nr:arsenosugar biosynthesis radical SAM protein ArsS [bacterium]MDB4809708.1 arsenosugar biosynthesis radical SAM protein ArsS [bacterium]